MHRFLLLIALTALAACSSDKHEEPPHGERPAVCDEIGERCHSFDTGSGLASECHKNAHATWDEATCNAKRAECLAACPVSDAGTDAAGDTAPVDAGDTGTDETSPADASDASDATDDAAEAG